ncbi:unnamed protein product [Rhodiola kirilowii]
MMSDQASFPSTLQTSVSMYNILVSAQHEEVIGETWFIFKEMHFLDKA